MAVAAVVVCAGGSGGWPTSNACPIVRTMRTAWSYRVQFTSHRFLYNGTPLEALLKNSIVDNELFE